MFFKAENEVCIVVGGGNMLRGISGASQGIDRVTADGGMGMLSNCNKCISITKCYRKKMMFPLEFCLQFRCKLYARLLLREEQ